MDTTVSKLYEEDFYAWTKAQAAALRRLAAEHWNGPLDLDRLAEEVEDLGNSERYTVESQVERLLLHLLKLEYSPAAQPRRQWLLSVLNARAEIDRRLSSAMRREVEAKLDNLYRTARAAARIELTEHDEFASAELLPKRCPYGWAQLLDENWFPANRHGLTDPGF